jgi:hypothetical protein
VWLADRSEADRTGCLFADPPPSGSGFFRLHELELRMIAFLYGASPLKRALRGVTIVYGCSATQLVGYGFGVAIG